MIPAKKPWWNDYRQKQYKLQKTLTMEMIVRKSFLEVLREYVDNCSISGVTQLCEPKLWWPQRMVRVCTFGSMVALVGYFLYNTWIGTLSNPLIVTSESSTYPIADIDFPAVALCNVNRISLKALKAFARSVYPDLALKNESLEEVEKFCLQTGRLLDFSYMEMREGSNFLEIIAAEDFNTRRIVNVMKMLAPSCSEMLVRCSWGGNELDCNSLFTVRRTAHGHCCAFNYILDYDSVTSLNSSTIGVAKRQILPGYPYGLNVILDPLLDDYAYPLNNFNGFDVLLFDPTHFADLSAGRVIHRLAEPNQAVFMELKSFKQVASPEVRKYPLTIRKCLFKDERKKKFNGTYSYSACIVRCRIKAVQSLCKCTPYFLPTDTKGPICTMNDLKCLNKYKEKLLYLYPMDAEKTEGLEVEMEDSLFCPDCLPDCELTQHFSKSYKSPMELLGHKLYYLDSFMKNLNMTDKCFLSVHHAVSDGVLDRLDVVAYWFEVLSNIGGFGGVLIGFSIVSVVEIVYFFIVRFIIIIRYNYIKYH